MIILIFKYADGHPWTMHHGFLFSLGAGVEGRSPGDLHRHRDAALLETHLRVLIA